MVLRTESLRLPAVAALVAALRAQMESYAPALLGRNVITGKDRAN
jgi:hypothetical protein